MKKTGYEKRCQSNQDNATGNKYGQPLLAEYCQRHFQNKNALKKKSYPSVNVYRIPHNSVLDLIHTLLHNMTNQSLHLRNRSNDWEGQSPDLSQLGF